MRRWKLKIVQVDVDALWFHLRDLHVHASPLFCIHFVGLSPESEHG